jgi:hypothetical protein
VSRFTGTAATLSDWIANDRLVAAAGGGRRSLLAAPQDPFCQESISMTASTSLDPSVEASAGVCVIHAQWPVPARPNLNDRVVR